MVSKSPILETQSACNYTSELRTWVMSQCRCQDVSAGSISWDRTQWPSHWKSHLATEEASWDNTCTIQSILGMNDFDSQLKFYNLWHFNILSPLSITKLGLKTKNWPINSRITVSAALVTKPLWWNNMINQEVLLLVIGVNNVTKECVFVTSSLNLEIWVLISISSHLIQLITHINSSNKTNLKMLIFH